MLTGCPQKNWQEACTTRAVIINDNNDQLISSDMRQLEETCKVLVPQVVVAQDIRMYFLGGIDVQINLEQRREME